MAWSDDWLDFVLHHFDGTGLWMLVGYYAYPIQSHPIWANPPVPSNDNGAG